MKKDHPAGAGRIPVLAVLLAALLSAGMGHAAAGEGIPRISIKELKDMLDQGKPVTIIDTQPESVYAEGHIKGAISIQWKSQIALEDVWSLPNDIPIVTYCDCGPGESDSADVAAQLIRMGFEDVLVLEDPSIRGWKEAGYPTENK
ncbi:MAG: rhodanese-like domain-containing protein [Acidobacteria bacterium]|nr:rhodanese-like domain-containing protein [Acidobacteriota bacterium]